MHDEHDTGAWELVAHTLARSCGLRVPESTARRFAHPHHTFLVKRFDRTTAGRRLHFASAMTLTGHQDGDDASTGASYLEIARVLIDHLRNHGFILVPGKGWRLSGVYDMNPVPESHGLKLNISEADNAMDIDLVRSVAPYFRVDANTANEVIERSGAIVRQWSRIATGLGVPGREQERMAAAFRLAG